MAALCAAIFLLCRSMQEQGHGWGDDFALYIDQARSLTDGSVADVTSLTRFALDNSAYNSFSAYVYPWVFPILLAPIVAVKGLDYSTLKLVGTLSFVVALFFLHRIVRHRAGTVGALAVVLAIGLNNVYIGYTDAVLSDLTFVALVLVTLWWIDRMIRTGALFGAARRPLIVLGLLAAAAFNTRREGSALMLAIAVAQAANWRAAQALAEQSARRWRQVAATAAVPYAAFAVATIVLLAVLPGQPYPRFDSSGGSGLHNVMFNLKWYRLPLAEVLGLKDVGPTQLSLLGSHTLADVIFWSFIVAVLIGATWRLLSASVTDAHLVAALVGLAAVILSPPFREQRYLLSVTPLMMYFAWQGVRATCAAVAYVGHGAAPAGEPDAYATDADVPGATPEPVPDRQRAPRSHSLGRLVPALLATAAISVLAIAVGTDTWHAYQYHRDNDYVEWGPESPSVQEAFAAVMTYTDARDVITFFQARTLNLYTRRRAIQGNSEQMMVQRANWYLMARDSDYIQTNLSAERAAQLGFVKVWENARFVLWRIPPRYPPLAAGPGSTSLP